MQRSLLHAHLAQHLYFIGHNGSRWGFCFELCVCIIFVVSCFLGYSVFKGELYYLPPKFEHTFVGVITFFTFLLGKHF